MIGMLISLSILVSSMGWAFFQFYGKMVRALTEVKSIQSTQHADHVETRHFLLSTIDWKTHRQKLILFMRDEIVREWSLLDQDIDYDKAYCIAENNMKEYEKYPYIDVLLILALQWNESRFCDTAVSPAGALGIMQIMPATGRLLAGFFHMEYSNSLLINITTSIRFGTKYLDVLYAQYGEPEIVLAAYNGGFWQAHYYREGIKKKLSPETASYVPTILNKWKEYKEKFKVYRIDTQMNIK